MPFFVINLFQKGEIINNTKVEFGKSLESNTEDHYGDLFFKIKQNTTNNNNKKSIYGRDDHRLWNERVPIPSQNDSPGFRAEVG